MPGHGPSMPSMIDSIEFVELYGLHRLGPARPWEAPREDDDPGWKERSEGQGRMLADELEEK